MVSYLTLQHPACLVESLVVQDSSVHCPVRVPVESKHNINQILKRILLLEN